MIEAASTCPGCIAQVLALDPQPGREPRMHGKSGNYYAFACHCGSAWAVRVPEAELNYRWLKSVGLLKPQVARVAAIPTDYVTRKRLDLYVRPRTQRVLSRLQN